jgi:very-short-patch-repair endonuclease
MREELDKITSRGRELRRNSTTAEEILWQHVRDNRLGWKIVRQKPILVDYFGEKRAFVADFYCKKAGLVIEVDGKVHLQQKEYDELRTSLLNQTGFRLMRFTNEEILNSPFRVARKIQNELANHVFPLSASGEGMDAKRQG